MRTTIDLADDVIAIVAAEQRRTGESRGQVIGRLVRRAVGDATTEPPPLPLLEGGLLVDVTDVSSLLVELDEADAADRGQGAASAAP